MIQERNKAESNANNCRKFGKGRHLYQDLMQLSSETAPYAVVKIIFRIVKHHIRRIIDCFDRLIEIQSLHLVQNGPKILVQYGETPVEREVKS